MDHEFEKGYERARHFFNERYLDRGMLKWMGYYLSDHTQSIAKDARAQVEIDSRTRKQEMTESEISDILFHSYENTLPVVVQVSGQTIEGTLPEKITGKVLGYDENNAVFIGKQAIIIKDIWWVGYLD